MPPKKPASAKPASPKPASATAKPAARKPAAKKPTARKSAGKTPAGKTPATTKPATQRPATPKPATRKRSAKKPVSRGGSQSRSRGRARRRKEIGRIVVAFVAGAAIAVTVITVEHGTLTGHAKGPGTATSTTAVRAGQPDLAETNPADPTGRAISLTQSASQAANTLNCTLTVPARPLSAAGLATPWRLGDGCSQVNPEEQAFVESTILAPDGHITIYDPLVITQGTTAASAPGPPVIPAGAQVIIDIGFNGANLVLEGAGAAQGQCVDAFGNSIISQTAACNAPAFYAAANAEIAAGTLSVPPLGTGSDGKACPTTESFSLVDQDQSDNVDSAYLLNRKGQTAQATAANKRAMGGATEIANGSDDGLLAHFIDPALGCTPYKAGNVTSVSGSDSSQALESLSALHDQGMPRALLPVNDPQLLVAGKPSLGKTNAYRAETDQPPLPAGTNEPRNAAAYCQDMVNIQSGRLHRDLGKERGFASPDPAAGTNLATFMGARLSVSFGNLGCKAYGLQDPVKVTVNRTGVATGVTYSTSRQRASVPAR